jgi:hypothetical protein
MLLSESLSLPSMACFSSQPPSLGLEVFWHKEILKVARTQGCVDDDDELHSSSMIPEDNPWNRLSCYAMISRIPLTHILCAYSIHSWSFRIWLASILQQPKFNYGSVAPGSSCGADCIHTLYKTFLEDNLATTRSGEGSQNRCIS